MKNLASIYLTCPMFYANAKPHLGHAYTLCLADAWARYMRIRGDPSLKAFYQPKTVSKAKKITPVFLASGTDEHGNKVKRAAGSVGKSPMDYCNEMSLLFKDLCRATSVELGDFVRTTDERHKAAVTEMWNRLDTKGYIYQDRYTGWYSTTDEAFYRDREVITSSPTDRGSQRMQSKDNENIQYVSTETGSPVEWVEEMNYRFCLTLFKSKLHNWIDSGVFVQTSASQSTLQQAAHEMVENCQDISISRPVNRLDWGIPVPNDLSQVIYVWFDALVSYLTAVGFPETAPDTHWPPNVQFIGRDILRFHTVLWPALLMAIDLPPPKQLVCHFHLLMDGKKMSKSLGNVADPFEEQLSLTPSRSTSGEDSIYGDALRYVLLRSALLTSDSSYNRSNAQRLINSELVNLVGNLLSRVTSKSLNPGQSIMRTNREEVNAVFGKHDEDIDLIDRLDNLAERFDDTWCTQLQPHNAIELILGAVRRANAFLDRHKPWDPRTNIPAEFVLSVCAETLRLSGLLLHPIIPNLSDRLLCRLGIHERDQRTKGDKTNQVKTLCSSYFWTLGPPTGVFFSRLPEGESKRRASE